jgi:peptidoglycan/LPS O-acetylase OafA/YrhL
MSSATIAAFLLALVVNGLVAPSMGATAQRLEGAPLNPPGWAFSIWGVFYFLFAIGLLCWGLQGSADALPLLLALAWLANAAWLAAVHFDNWALGLLLIVVYWLLALGALTQLKEGEGVGFALISASMAGICVWLTLATLLNVEIVVPASGGAVKAAALPLVLGVAFLLVIHLAGWTDALAWPAQLACYLTCLVVAGILPLS